MVRRTPEEIDKISAPSLNYNRFTTEEDARRNRARLPPDHPLYEPLPPDEALRALSPTRPRACA